MRSIVRAALSGSCADLLGKPQLDAKGPVACADLICADPAPAPMIESLAAQGQLIVRC